MMPAQTTIPSKALNYHALKKNQDIPWQKQIITISFHKSSPTKDNRWKTSTERDRIHQNKQTNKQTKPQESNLLPTKSKEDSHTNINYIQNQRK